MFIFTALSVKNLPAMRETWVWFLGWEDPPENEWQPTLALLPGESHGQRSPAAYSPCVRKSRTWLSDQTTQQIQWVLLAKYTEDRNFVLKDDSAAVFFKVLIVIGSWPINLAIKSVCSLWTGRQALWECYPVSMRTMTSFLTLRNAMTIFWQWHHA